MNRQQRRSAKKAKPRKKNQAWKLTREQRLANLERNGITAKDVERAFEDGRDKTAKAYTKYTMSFFYSAAAISAKRLFGFGEKRIIRLLDSIQQIMAEEITTCDIIERCKQETGIDVNFDGYDN